MSGITAGQQPKKSSRKLKRKIAEQCCKFLFPLLFLIVYCLIMGAIFYSIERDCKSVYHCPVTTIGVKRIAQAAPTTPSPTIPAVTTVEWSSTSNTIGLTTIPSNSTATTTTPTPAPMVVTSTITVYNISKTVKDESPWSELTFMAAFHFVLISVLTIGYGDIYPCSVGGQIFTIVVTIIGIPITLMALTRTATLFSKGLLRVWLFTYMKRKKPPHTKKQKRYVDNDVYVPFIWGVVITVIWILLSAEFFFLTLFDTFNPDPDTPPFTYFLAFYFTMISFLTIGFGDYAPVKYDLIFVTMIFLIVGLALVTMCIDLVQLEFDLIFTDVIDMIEDQYHITLDNEGEPVDSKEGVKELIDKNASLSTKMMTKFMSKDTKKQLEEVYEEKAKFLPMNTQTVRNVEDQLVQAFVEEIVVVRVDFSCQCDLKDDEDTSIDTNRHNIEKHVKLDEKHKKHL